MGAFRGMLVGRRRVLLPALIVTIVVAIAATSVPGIPGRTSGPVDATAAPTTMIPPRSISVPEVEQVVLVDELGIDLRVPAGWTRGNPSDVNTIVLAGATPRGSIAVYHGPLVSAAVCDPGCETLDLPDFIPPSLEKSSDALAAAIAARSGGDAWGPAAGAHPRIVDARRLDVPGDGSTPRRTYVIGSYLSQLIAISITAAEGPGADGLVAGLLGNVQPFPTSESRPGTPARHAARALGYEVTIPNLWPASRAGAPPGATRFGGEAMTISVAVRGVLAVCDPTCRSITDRTLSAVASAVFKEPALGVTTGRTELDGRPARSSASSRRPARRPIA